ncbi:hypothetical protein KEM52_000670 [Ascosphaera acerosa]|nr:hypothetical protein KEM52_000670 [Ascosphaera acerosa]
MPPIPMPSTLTRVSVALRLREDSDSDSNPIATTPDRPARDIGTVYFYVCAPATLPARAFAAQCIVRARALFPRLAARCAASELRAAQLVDRLTGADLPLDGMLVPGAQDDDDDDDDAAAAKAAVTGRHRRRMDLRLVLRCPPSMTSTTDSSGQEAAAASGPRAWLPPPCPWAKEQRAGRGAARETGSSRRDRSPVIVRSFLAPSARDQRRQSAALSEGVSDGGAAREGAVGQLTPFGGSPLGEGRSLAKDSDDDDGGASEASHSPGPTPHHEEKHDDTDPAQHDVGRTTDTAYPATEKDPAVTHPSHSDLSGITNAVLAALATSSRPTDDRAAHSTEHVHDSGEGASADEQSAHEPASDSDDGADADADAAADSPVAATYETKPLPFQSQPVTDSEIAGNYQSIVDEVEKLMAMHVDEDETPSPGRQEEPSTPPNRRKRNRKRKRARQLDGETEPAQAAADDAGKDGRAVAASQAASHTVSQPDVVTETPNKKPKVVAGKDAERYSGFQQLVDTSAALPTPAAPSPATSMLAADDGGRSEEEGEEDNGDGSEDAKSADLEAAIETGDSIETGQQDAAASSSQTEHDDEDGEDRSAQEAHQAAPAHEASPSVASSQGDADEPAELTAEKTDDSHVSAEMALPEVQLQESTGADAATPGQATESPSSPSQQPEQDEQDDQDEQEEEAEDISAFTYQPSRERTLITAAQTELALMKRYNDPRPKYVDLLNRLSEEAAILIGKMEDGKKEKSLQKSRKKVEKATGKVVKWQRKHLDGKTMADVFGFAAPPPPPQGGKAGAKTTRAAKRSRKKEQASQPEINEADKRAQATPAPTQQMEPAETSSLAAGQVPTAAPEEHDEAASHDDELATEVPAHAESSAVGDQDSQADLLEDVQYGQSHSEADPDEDLPESHDDAPADSDVEMEDADAVSNPSPQLSQQTQDDSPPSSQPRIHHPDDAEEPVEDAESADGEFADGDSALANDEEALHQGSEDDSGDSTDTSAEREPSTVAEVAGEREAAAGPDMGASSKLQATDGLASQLDERPATPDTTMSDDTDASVEEPVPFALKSSTPSVHAAVTSVPDIAYPELPELESESGFETASDEDGDAASHEDGGNVSTAAGVQEEVPEAPEVPLRAASPASTSASTPSPPASPAQEIRSPPAAQQSVLPSSPAASQGSADEDDQHIHDEAGSESGSQSESDSESERESEAELRAKSEAASDKAEVEREETTNSTAATKEDIKPLSTPAGYFSRGLASLSSRIMPLFSSPMKADAQSKTEAEVDAHETGVEHSHSATQQQSTSLLEADDDSTASESESEDEDELQPQAPTLPEPVVPATTSPETKPSEQQPRRSLNLDNLDASSTSSESDESEHEEEASQSPKLGGPVANGKPPAKLSWSQPTLSSLAKTSSQPASKTALPASSVPLRHKRPLNQPRTTLTPSAGLADLSSSSDSDDDEDDEDEDDAGVSAPLRRLAPPKSQPLSLGRLTAPAASNSRQKAGLNRLSASQPAAAGATAKKGRNTLKSLLDSQRASFGAW